MKAAKRVAPSARTFHIPDRVAWAGLSTAILLFFWIYDFRAAPQRIGDGWEYMLMSCNWTRHFTPWAVKDALAACKAEMGYPGPDATAAFAGHVGTGYDAYHFWLFPLFAAPFMVLCRVAGANLAWGFPLLHLAILAGSAWQLIRRLGQWPAMVVMVVMACSPLVFFSNKAHSEFFVATGVLLAFLALYGDGVLEAAFWLGLVANQQLTIAPFGYGLLAWWFLRDRQRLLDPRSWLRALPAIAAPLLCPVYYELRYGVPSLGVVSNDYSGVGLHRAMALFVDPDLGLFPNWPLGLALVAAAAVCAVVLRKTLRRMIPLAVFTACWIVLLPLAMTVQSNWNSGGTVFISRYAVYHIPPVAIWFAVLARRAAAKYVPGFPRSAVAVAGVLAVMLAAAWAPFRYNLAVFHPSQGERYVEHTRFANWFYNRFPGLYDPTPEIFLERSVGAENPGQYYTAGTWAVGNFTCTKLLLVRSREELGRMRQFEKPIGCYGEIDTKGVVADLLSGKIKPTPRGYINQP